jgi:cellobiose transport system substrate-binding protein
LTSRHGVLGPLPAAVLVAAALAAACAGNAATTPPGETATPATGCTGGLITLTVGVYGDFGYAEAGLYDAYMKSHPCIRIAATSQDNEHIYWSSLQTHLSAGSGVDDIQAIAAERIADVVANQTQLWVDLDGFPDGPSVAAGLVRWWLAPATTLDRRLLALGSDITPLAMCYQPELLEAAGLPTDHARLEALVPNWDAYVALGKEYRDSLPSGAAWMDSGAGLFSAAVGAGGAKYTDASGDLIYDTNPVVKTAWDLAVDAIQSGLTTRLTPSSAAWDDALSQPLFATMACPSSMLAYIKDHAGTAGRGRWSVMRSPGAGHSGGSYLGIPAASRHKAEAWDLLKFLTSADAQAAVFQRIGNYPASIEAQDELKDYTDSYFNGSPIGAVYEASAAVIPIQAVGFYDGDVESAIRNGLLEIAQKGIDPGLAWEHARESIDAAVGQ